MVSRGVTFCQCDVCGHTAIYKNVAEARFHGWSFGRCKFLSASLFYAWCPIHSVFHRRGRPKKNK